MKTARWLGLGAPLGFAIAALVATASEGCTITTGDSGLDGGGYNGNNNSDADTGTGNVCYQCLFQQCSGSWTVCQNDAECLATYMCATNCASAANPQECVNACYCDHPAGQSKYVALAACDSYHECGTCKSECPTLATAEACVAPGSIDRDICGVVPVDDAGVDATPAEDAAPPQDAALPPTDAAVVVDCTSCTTNICAAEKSACVSGSECETYTLCVAACTDSSCFDGCDSRYAAGKAASKALETCTVSNCKDACGL